MLAQFIPPPFAKVLSTTVFEHQTKVLREVRLQEDLCALGEASDDYAEVFKLQQQQALVPGEVTVQVETSTTHACVDDKVIGHHGKWEFMASTSGGLSLRRLCDSTGDAQGSSELLPVVSVFISAVGVR